MQFEKILFLFDNVNHLYNEMIIGADDQAQKYLFIRFEISRNILHICMLLSPMNTQTHFTI